MKDRIPANPGRVLITPENGAEAFYATMTRADDPTEEGTKLNKANLLKDATAALFGLGSNAVPDEVLAFLGKYAQHWWLRTNQTPVSYYAEVRTKTTGNIVVCYSDARTISYSSEISIDQETGAVSLVNPQTITSNKKSTLTNAIKGKYATNFVDNSTTIYYVDSTLVYADDEIGYGAMLSSGGGYAITSTLSERPAGDIDYVQSTDRNAYPDRGESGGYEYQYLGIPFENAVNGAKIETGSYIGTGTYGSSNPCSFTFDFVPSLLIISSSDGSAYLMAFNYGNEAGLMMTSSSWYAFSNRNADIKFTWDKTVSWYSTKSALIQLNKSGNDYVVYAFR